MLRLLSKAADVSNKCYNILRAFLFPYVSSAKVKLIKWYILLTEFTHTVTRTDMNQGKSFPNSNLR
jgi:hypothetical protein